MTEQRGERYLIDLYGWTVLGVRRGEDGQWRARYLCTDGGERRCVVDCPVRYRPDTLVLRPAEVTITRGADGVPVVVIVRLVRTRKGLPPNIRWHLWRNAGPPQGAGAGPGEAAGV